MFAHPNFNLEQYHLAQALDYFFFMDDDTLPHMVSESYIAPEVAHTTDTLPLKTDTGDSVSVFTA